MKASSANSDLIRLRELESVVDRAREQAGLALHEIGAALYEIRERRLYKAANSVWEWRDYVRERWSISKAYANRLIGHYRIRDQLRPLNTVLPTSERQTRPLIGFDDDTAVTIWLEAVEQAPAGGLSGRHVETIARRYRRGGRRALEDFEPHMTVSDPDRYPPPDAIADSDPEAIEHRRVVCQFRQIEVEADRFQDILRRANLPSGQALLTLALNEWLDRSMPGERHFQFTDEYVETRRRARLRLQQLKRARDNAE